MHEQRIRSDLAEDLRRASPVPHASGRGESDVPLDIVVFGGTGDLSWRKLLPALHMAHLHGSLAAGARIIGVGRQAWGREDYVRFIEEHAAPKVRAAQSDVDAWLGFLALLDFVSLDALDAAGYVRLAGACRPGSRRIYYLATAPSLFAPIAANLSASGLVDAAVAHRAREADRPRPRLGARRSTTAWRAMFDEDQIFRIDHYLGKETVQNLLALRFANALFEPLWNARYIDHVQITVAETVGVEGRGGYYDDSGALRDMVQNHMLQLLCLIAMEPPSRIDPDAVRNEKIKVLRALRRSTPRTPPADTVRGQYARRRRRRRARCRAIARSWRPDDSAHRDLRRAARPHRQLALGGRAVLPAHRQAHGRAAAPRSSSSSAECRISIFGSRRGRRLQPNRLVIRLQPEERIELRLMTKTPGLERRASCRQVALDLDLHDDLRRRMRRRWPTSGCCWT